MPHYYGNSNIDTRDFQRSGRQGIDTCQPRSKGQTFNARLNLISKIGSVFSLFFGGKRYGSARVIADPCNDARYHIEMQRNGGMNPANMADRVYTFEVEHSDFAPLGEYRDPST